MDRSSNELFLGSRKVGTWIMGKIGLKRVKYIRTQRFFVGEKSILIKRIESIDRIDRTYQEFSGWKRIIRDPWLQS